MGASTDSPPWLARVFWTLALGIVIDGISEVVKFEGDVITSYISGYLKSQKFYRNDTIFWGVVLVVLFFALFGVLKKLPKYESHRVVWRAVFLFVALLLVGMSHVWPAMINHPLMMTQYGAFHPKRGDAELDPEEDDTFYDVDRHLAPEWNHRIMFRQNSEPKYRCVEPCSFILVYEVPKLFRTGIMTFRFDKDNVLLQKCWDSYCDPE
jgi:hypothetical protein